MRITILNWRKFQHYGKRRPPWIKIYRTILESREWFDLPDSAARLLVECWLIASESDDGTIDIELNDLAWRLRKPDASKVLADLNILQDNNFLEVDSKVLAPRLQVTIPEGETETEKSGHYSTAFEQWWSNYPRKVKKHRSFTCWKARLKEGVEVEELTAALERYNRKLKAEGTEEEFIQHPTTFLAKGGGYVEEWKLKMSVPGTQGGAGGGILDPKFSQVMEPIIHERPAALPGEMKGNTAKVVEGILERAEKATS